MKVNILYTYFLFLLIFSYQASAYEVDDNTKNTANISPSPIETLSNTLIEVGTINDLPLSKNAIIEKTELKAVSPNKPEETKKEIADSDKLQKEQKTLPFNKEMGEINSPNVGEVESKEDKNIQNNSSTSNYLSMFGKSENYTDSYSKKAPNKAELLFDKVGNIAKNGGITNDLLNQVGLTPNLAKRNGAPLEEAPKVSSKENPTETLMPESASSTSFGKINNDKTSSLDAISKPTGMSASEMLQKTLDALNKKEEEKKIAEKKEDLGKNIQKFSKLESPIAKEDYYGLKKLFQDKDNISFLDDMEALDPSFFNNTNEAYYGKEGVGNHGERDNDDEGKKPLVNFLEQFKNRISANPEILKQRNSPHRNSYIPHDRSRNEDTH